MNTPIAKPKAVILNSMWRTGSTYLAKQFESVRKYQLYYEPDHEYVSTAYLKIGTEEERIRRSGQLRHPMMQEPIFAPYLEVDPLSGRPLYEHCNISSSFRDVYNSACQEYLAFLMACSRVAHQRQRECIFGFCRSGLQHRAWDEAFSGSILYLWRDPREQYRSYSWPTHNQYFVPATVAQLLLSKPLTPIVDELASSPGLRLVRTILQSVPPRHWMWYLRIGRMVAASLGADRVYAMFYLSWLASYRSGHSTADLAFSLTGLSKDARLRAEVESRYDIRFNDLMATPGTVVSGINYSAVERRVEKLGEPLFARIH